VAGVGCGQPETTISGKITYQGKVPFAGEVLFVDEQGNGKTAILADDGTYTIRSAWPGKWRVAVSSPSKFPAKYSHPSTSDLTVELVPGSNNFSVDLP
jgi:hypothetical protein